MKCQGLLLNLFSFSTVLCFLVTILLLQITFVKGGITIKKRAKSPSDQKIKSYCILTEKERDDSLFKTYGSKINCSQVPGLIIKLHVGDDSYLNVKPNQFIAPGKFCALTGNPVYGKLCPSQDPLWRKCCQENEVLDATSFKCRRSRTVFRPKVRKFVPQSFVVPTNNSKTALDRKALGVKLRCATGFVSKVYSSNPCLPESNGIFHLAPNGTPMYEVSTGVFLRKTQLKSVDHDSYCIDGILDFSSSSCPTFTGNAYHTTDVEYEKEKFDDNNDNEGNCRNAAMGEVLVVCMEDQETILNEDGDDDVPKAYLFAALWLSTCPFLVSSAIVNSCVIQKNVHGWILTSYLISMFLVNINSVVLILDINIPVPSSSSSSILGEPTTAMEGGCGLLDFTMKFIYLSSLCWMSSMCMNMLQTFSSTVPQVVVEPHRFLMSAIFSLGFPVVAVTVSYYVGSLPDDVSLLQDLHNNGGGNNSLTLSQTSQQPTCQKSTCALYSYKTIPYYSGPIIFLVLCNAVAFLITSNTIASLRRQAEAVLHKQTKDHLESFALFAKLFLLTGSIWLIRVVLLVLQIQSLYVTWYGIALEAVFSIPEVVFPMIIFHHPEFIKWASHKSPMISRFIIKCSPFCKKDMVFKIRTNSPESESVNQMSSVAQQYHHHSHPSLWSSSSHTIQPICISDTTTTGAATFAVQTDTEATTV